jgi:hypothetical protein
VGKSNGCLLLDLILSFAAHHRGDRVLLQWVQQRWRLHRHDGPPGGGLPGGNYGAAESWQPVCGGPGAPGSPRSGNKMRHVLLYASHFEALGDGLVTIRFYC